MIQENSINWKEVSTVFSLLGNERRLYVVLCLREAESPMTVRDLAVEIAAKERDSCPDSVSDEFIARVHRSLFHTHLPKLQEMKVIEYNHATEFIIFSNNSTEVESVIDAVSDKYATS